MILVYDSGLGGLSSLNNLVRNYPQYNFIFFGDRDNAPYGNKSEEQLQQLFLNNINKFKSYPISDIIVQCNTLCSSLNLQAYPFKMHDIINKTLKLFTNKNRDSSILVVGTSLTIANKRYQNGLTQMGYHRVDAYPLKDLAGMIEKYASEEEIKEYIISELPKKSYDYVILGCTHFPFYKDIFANFLNAQIIDSTNLTYSFSDQTVSEGKLYLKLAKTKELIAFLDKHLKVNYEWL